MNPLQSVPLSVAVRTKNILLLDDTDTTRGALAAQIASWGYRVRPAESLKEALDIMDREPVDLMIMHVVMSAVVYGAILTKLSHHRVGFSVPIILCNAFQDKSSEAAHVKIRFAGKLTLHWLPRPFAPQALQSELKTIFDERERAYRSTQALAIRSLSAAHEPAPAPIPFSGKKILTIVGLGLMVVIGIYYAITQSMYRRALENRRRQEAENAKQQMQVVEQLPTLFEH